MDLARSVTEESIEKSKRMDFNKKKKEWLKYEILLDFLHEDFLTHIQEAEQNCINGIPFVKGDNQKLVYFLFL